MRNNKNYVFRELLKVFISHLTSQRDYLTPTSLFSIKVVADEAGGGGGKNACASVCGRKGLACKIIFQPFIADFCETH